MKSVNVMNLSTGEEILFVGPGPVEALISQAILSDKRISNFRLTDTRIRKEVESKVIISKSGKTASINDLSVVL